jgi:hypothetical protein
VHFPLLRCILGLELDSFHNFMIFQGFSGVQHFPIRSMLHCIFIFEPTTYSGQQPFRASHPFGCQKLG